MANKKTYPKNNLVIILGTGGHTTQMIKLVDLLGYKYNYTYAINKDDNFSEKKIKVKGEVFKVTYAAHLKENVLVKIITTLRCAIESFFILLKLRPSAIISAGPSTAVVISLVGKLFGSKIIFIESWSRVSICSSSGKIIYRFADLFFVQWKELKKQYPKAMYAGRLG